MSSLLVIDDDDLSREVLVLLATEQGYLCEAEESGLRALEWLAGGGAVPDVVLADMQMPGLSGESLARLLRVACGEQTVLLAMSGSQPKEELRGFDGFLLKPFAIADLEAAIAGRGREEAASSATVVLNREVYASLAEAMPRSQLQALYALCLDDAEKRLLAMQSAAEVRDGHAYARAAHAIKGGCGMVGATELAGMAAAMETDGLPEVDNKAPFVEFMAALSRMRRMLDAQTE